MYQDLVQYRGELGRVADLLQGQLKREKQMHEMMETLLGHQESMMHAARGHGEQTRQLLDPMQQTEQELARIMQLLSVPLIPEVAPRPTSAAVPSIAVTSTPLRPTSRPATPTRPPPGGSIFDMMDRNHDGVISRDEFRRATITTPPGSCSVRPGLPPQQFGPCMGPPPPGAPMMPFPCAIPGPPPPAGGIVTMLPTPAPQACTTTSCIRPMMPPAPPMGAPCMCAS